jgi:prephenate dehydrogenase
MRLCTEQGEDMTIGIIGLGLIGGSMAKAFRRDPESVILGMDTDKKTVEAALLSRDIDGRLTEEKYGLCDLILLAAYPEGSIEWLRENAARIPAHVLVVDCLGVKEKICRMGFELAERYGFTFVGGHPMAGTQYSGFRYAKEDMFDSATMVLVPPPAADTALVEQVKGCFAPARFGRFIITTAEKHDAMIAFTSQLAHVVASSYIKSPTADEPEGFSAGSYRDLTRVAWLSPELWAELLLENGDRVTAEIDHLIGHLKEYRDAIAGRDRDTLYRLLDEGRMRKKMVDERW